jgi:hypothetical protein
MTCKPELQQGDPIYLGPQGWYRLRPPTWRMKLLRFLLWPVVALVKWRVRRAIKLELARFHLVGTGKPEVSIRPLIARAMQHRNRSRRVRALRHAFKEARRRNRYR